MATALWERIVSYLTENQVRARASALKVAGMSDDTALMLRLIPQIFRSHFDIFLSHSICDAELIFGLKALIEAAGKTVYVDWIDDPALDRTQVSGATAETLRGRMRQCDSLFYVYSRHSQTSRWMPWELGYFDGHNGNVAILPVIPDVGDLSFEKEEFLQIYPKVDAVSITGTPGLFINRSRKLEQADYLDYVSWSGGDDKLRPRF